MEDWNLYHEKANEAKQAGWESIIWLRPQDIDSFKDTDKEGELELFAGAIEPNDIQ